MYTINMCINTCYSSRICPFNVFSQSKEEKTHKKKKELKTWERGKISICKQVKLFGHSIFECFLLNFFRSAQFSETTCLPTVMVTWRVSASWASASTFYFGKCRPEWFTLLTVSLFQGVGERFACALVLLFEWLPHPYDEPFSQWEVEFLVW